MAWYRWKGSSPVDPVRPVREVFGTFADHNMGETVRDRQIWRAPFIFFRLTFWLLRLTLI